MLLNNIPLKVFLDEGAFPIEYANEYAAGIDIRSPESISIWPGSSVTIDTGVHVEMPSDFCGLVVSKSGLNIKHGVTSTGLIDPDYRGPIVVKLYNSSDKRYDIAAGDKITQLLMLPRVVFNIEYTDKLSDLTKTERGDKGFGSTGR